MQHWRLSWYLYFVNYFELHMVKFKELLQKLADLAKQKMSFVIY